MMESVGRSLMCSSSIVGYCIVLISVSAEKCEGPGFDPPEEQLLFPFFLAEKNFLRRSCGNEQNDIHFKHVHFFCPLM